MHPGSLLTARPFPSLLLTQIHIDKVLGFGSMGMVYHGRLYDTRVSSWPVRQ